MKTVSLSLPNAVAEKDRKLSEAGEQLAELRWHWTLDESNPKRVSIAEYARSVSVHPKVISNDAEAWGSLLKTEAKAKETGTTPKKGAPKTISDHRKLAEMGEQRGSAAKAIAESSGVSVATVVRHKSDEINDVINTASARVARKKDTANPTTIEHEIPKVAKEKAKKATAEKAKKAEQKAKHTASFMKAEGKASTMIKAGGDWLDITEGVSFSTDELTLLNQTLDKLQALVTLMKLRTAGEVNIDWDAEFQKITTA